MGTTERVGPKKQMNSFLAKMKKQNSAENITNQIKNLGFVGDVSANQLAASGIQLSIREVIAAKLLAEQEEAVAEAKEKEAAI